MVLAKRIPHQGRKSLGEPGARVICVILLTSTAAAVVTLTRRRELTLAVVGRAIGLLPRVDPETTVRVVARFDGRLDLFLSDRRALARTILWATGNWLYRRSAGSARGVRAGRGPRVASALARRTRPRGGQPGVGAGRIRDTAPQRTPGRDHLAAGRILAPDPAVCSEVRVATNRNSAAPATAAPSTDPSNRSR
jgi:hypothetical protein